MKHTYAQKDMGKLLKKVIKKKIVDAHRGGKELHAPIRKKTQ